MLTRRNLTKQNTTIFLNKLTKQKATQTGRKEMLLLYLFVFFLFFPKRIYARDRPKKVHILKQHNTYCNLQYQN